MTNPPNKQNPKQATNFAKYTGISFQMLAVIGVFVFIGYKIDEHRGGKTMIFTAILGVVGVVVSLIQVVRMLGGKG